MGQSKKSPRRVGDDVRAVGVATDLHDLRHIGEDPKRIADGEHPESDIGRRDWHDQSAIWVLKGQ